MPKITRRNLFGLAAAAAVVPSLPAAAGWAAGAAPSTANTLDDYEEGTAYIAGQPVRYTKIGRMVHIEGRITLRPLHPMPLRLPFA